MIAFHGHWIPAAPKFLPGRQVKAAQHVRTGLRLVAPVSSDLLVGTLHDRMPGQLEGAPLVVVLFICREQVWLRVDEALLVPPGR